MNDYQDTFKRYEKKYLLTEIQYKTLMLFLEGRCKMDRFGKSNICNIYFDTPNYQLIRNSLEKPIYKEKLRLRSYGMTEIDGTVFVELKKKYKGVVYKRRVDMKSYEAENYLYEKHSVKKKNQITNEIDWFLKYYQEIMPVMYISYQRIALTGIEDPNLRITFDKNILWREEELHLYQKIWGNPILQEEERLMEIKMAGSMPLWLAKLLDQLKIYPVSLSKYGKSYLKLQEKKREQKGSVVCA